MWKFIKKWFDRNQSEQRNENIFGDADCLKGQEKLNHTDLQTDFKPVRTYSEPHEREDNYDYGFSHKSLSEFEILILHLRSYSGYTREATLKQIQEDYQPELFPHLLERLSDYVDVNRKLASEHIVRWSQQAEFSKLCIDHFYDVAALKYRERTDQDSLHLLLSEVAKNKDYLSETLKSKQGKLPRVLLNFIIEYQWITYDDLTGLCRVAKDQHVRAFWLNDFIQGHPDHELMVELQRNSYKDVQYRLFDTLYQRDALSIELVVTFWESKFPSLIDYAYFVLRQKNFDFENYFSLHPIHTLTTSQARTRAKQWLLMKGERSVFLDILSQIDSKDISNALVLMALKQQYLSLEDYLSYFEHKNQKIEFWQLSKIKKVSQRYLSLDDLQKFLSLNESEISIKPRLSIVNGYSEWDQLYWFVINDRYVQTEDDRKIFDLHIAQQLHYLAYAVYGEQWTSSQKAEMQALLPAFIQSYPHIFENEKVRALLKPYLE